MKGTGVSHVHDHRRSTATLLWVYTSLVARPRRSHTRSQLVTHVWSTRHTLCKIKRPSRHMWWVGRVPSWPSSKWSWCLLGAASSQQSIVTGLIREPNRAVLRTVLQISLSICR